MQDLISNNAKEVSYIEFVKDKFLDDTYYGLQHCKLFSPQITPDGYFKGIIVDYYDFEYRPLVGTFKEIMQNYFNNQVYSMQEKEYLENL